MPWVIFGSWAFEVGENIMQVYLSSMGIRSPKIFNHWFFYIISNIRDILWGIILVWMRNKLNGFTYLNIWNSVSGAVWSGSVTFRRFSITKGSTLLWLDLEGLQPSHNSSSLSSFCVQVRCDFSASSSCTHDLPTIMDCLDTSGSTSQMNSSLNCLLSWYFIILRESI